MSIQDPGRKAFAVTPSDANELALLPSRLFIGTGGDVAVLAAEDTVSVIYKAASGSYLCIRAKKVLATGTTASAIVAEVA